jgi:hypothetical protein
MTINDVKMLKAKKELLEKQIRALDSEIIEIEEEIENIGFSAVDEKVEWENNKKKINKIVKEALPLLEIREYLKDVLDSIEQSDLDEYKKDKGGEDEG